MHTNSYNRSSVTFSTIATALHSDSEYDGNIIRNVKTTIQIQQQIVELKKRGEFECTTMDGGQWVCNKNTCIHNEYRQSHSNILCIRSSAYFFLVCIRAWALFVVFVLYSYGLCGSLNCIHDDLMLFVVIYTKKKCHMPI